MIKILTTFRKTLILLSFTLFFHINLFSQEAGIDFKKLETYIQKSMTDWKIPGLAIAIVQGDSVAFAKGFGVRDINTKESVNTETLFAIASNTKAFTVSALSLLVAQGKLKWDDKVIQYLPYFQMYDPYVTHEMTVRDLLCHRSGLATFSGDLLWYESNYSRKEVIQRAKYLKPTYGFRTHFGYSNIMFIAAGEVLEAITDTTWENYVKAKFFIPLGMKNTNTDIKDLKKLKNVASPHLITDSTSTAIKYMSWENAAPAAAINSNVSDMSRWLIMLANDGVYKGKKILGSRQLWEMESPQTLENFSREWATVLPSRHFEAYGMGLEMYDYHGFKVLYHGGGADGMISLTAFVPEKKLGMVILTNSINYLPTALMYYILDDFAGNPDTDWSAKYLQWIKAMNDNKKADELEMEKHRNKNSVPSLDLSEYTGTYGGEMYGNAEVKLENDKLVVRFIPTPIFIGDLTHFQYDTFRIKLRNSPGLPGGTVNFVLNAEGKVESMRIDIPNPDFDFTELEFKKLK
jgi:CubicO group peptidase (beta-lactamase class C family)